MNPEETTGENSWKIQKLLNWNTRQAENCRRKQEGREDNGRFRSKEVLRMKSLQEPSGHSPGYLDGRPRFVSESAEENALVQVGSPLGRQTSSLSGRTRLRGE